MQWVPGIISLGVKWPVHEADHSPPTSAKIKNTWSDTSTPPYAFMAWCSVKAQGQLYLFIFTKYKLVWRHTNRKESNHILSNSRHKQGLTKMEFCVVFLSLSCHPNLFCSFVAPTTNGFELQEQKNVTRILYKIFSSVCSGFLHK
jgi:hypothetical protein